MATVYYELRLPEKALNVINEFIKQVDTNHKEITVAYATRAVCLTTLGRYEEAMEALNKLEELPAVPVDSEMYPKITDAKWSHLLCKMEQKNKENKGVDLVEMCCEILLKHTPLGKQPVDMVLNAYRMTLFRTILEKDKDKIPQTLERLTKEIIENDNVHGYWKSLVIMLKIELLTGLTDIQRAAESYRAIMLSRNTHTMLALVNLSGQLLAAIPEVDRDMFLLALDDFAKMLFLNRDRIRTIIPTDRRYCFWINLALLSFSLHDINRARNFAECATLYHENLEEGDTHIANRIISTCYMQRKEFEKSVKYSTMKAGRVDKLFLMVLATSHVALGGEENFQKAFEFIKAIHSGPGSVELATKQLDILKSQRDKLLSQNASTEGLAKHWREKNSIGFPLIPLEKAVECANTILNLPEVSTPLMAIFRYDAINILGGKYKDSNNLQKAIENFEIVANEFPALALYDQMRLCYYHLGKIEELLEILHKIKNLTSNPADIDTVLGELAIVNIDIGKPDKAYEYLMQCTDKTSKLWLENMSDACKISGRTEEATKYVTQLMELQDADKPLTHLIRATLYVLMGRIEDAKADYEKVIDDPNMGAKATVGLAKIYETNYNDNAKALQMYASVVDKLPVDAHEGSATCLYKMNLNELALEQIELAFKHTQGPKSPWGLLLRGNIFGTLESPDKACADFTEVIAMNEDHAAEAYFCRGKIHYILGRKDEAASDFGNAVRLDPAREAQIQEFKTGIDKMLSDNN
eukprot:Phypoly_transcript_02810.p1 GENE.Phypoly_transcript_02810~~Phypoly_transcript_02810.p1  ORF type:complete len:879 (+),score=134.01 Phypoly_transcript_02810:377-2638(+)